MKDKIINMVLAYIEKQENSIFNPNSVIDSHFKYSCRLELSVTPTYLKIEDSVTGFKIVVHSNKNVIKICKKWGNETIYRSEYDYMDLLYHLSLIDNVSMYFYGKEMKDKVTEDLQIHSRNIIIENLLL